MRTYHETQKFLLDPFICQRHQMFMLVTQLYRNLLVGKMFPIRYRFSVQDLKRLGDVNKFWLTLINCQKTKSMIVRGKCMSENFVSSTSIVVNSNGSNIEHVSDFKLLGQAFYQDLSCNRQVEQSRKKLAKCIGLLHQREI